MNSKVGQHVVKNVTVAALDSDLGSQCVGSNLSIAVDPLDSRRVYVFWGDGANDRVLYD
jgi:hypothetical protein